MHSQCNICLKTDDPCITVWCEHLYDDSPYLYLYCLPCARAAGPSLYQGIIDGSIGLTNIEDIKLSISKEYQKKMKQTPILVRTPETEAQFQKFVVEVEAIFSEKIASLERAQSLHAQLALFREKNR